MDCRDVERFLQPFLDDEFAEQDRVPIAAHLQICPSCRAAAAAQRELKRKLGALAAENRAPSGLAGRVRLALADVQPVRKRHTSSSLLSGGVFLRWMVPAATAGALAVLMLSNKVDQRDPDLSSLALQGIELHRGRIPLDVNGPNEDQVRHYFADKVPFAVRPLPIHGADVQLVGGRLSSLREHPAAYLRYQMSGQRLSVFVLDGDVLERPAQGGLPHTACPIRWRRLHGYNVGQFNYGGTTYLVTTELEPSRLSRMLPPCP